MQKNAPTPPAAGINLSDIYYVLFRRKWLILFFTVAGLVAAGVVYVKMAPPYFSEAKLMVRYVTDSSQPTAIGPNADTVRRADVRGDGIIIGEAELLSSFDVAKEVVANLGAKKILGVGAAETNATYVASLLRKNLTVEPPKRGNVLRVSYHNADPSTVQPVLEEIVKVYFKKHLALHRDLGEFDEFFRQRAETLRADLSETEEQLRKSKARANVLSLDESKRFFADQRAKVNDELLRARSELAERQAALQELQKLLPVPATNQVKATNETIVAAVPSGPPPDKSREYQRVMERLNHYYTQDRDLRKIYTAEAILVKENQASIDELEVQKKKLEEEFPSLLEQGQKMVARGPENVSGPVPVNRIPELMNTELVRVRALTAKIKELNAQWDRLKADIQVVEGEESQITELQRKKEMFDSQIRVYSASLEQNRMDEVLSSGKLSNIKPIQEPSPPARDTSKVSKFMGMAAGGGIVIGLGLAFLLEFILNQTVRRASEIPSRFRLPVFISIPEFRQVASRRGKRKALTNGSPVIDAEAANGQAPNGETNGANLAVAKRASELAPWDEKHDLYPFSEALRDRLVTFFEVKGMTHKPKLIAMTSCGHGSGVTTVAAGLAASLSETGEGNVLLVDMNLEQGAAHPFYRGKPACGLEDLLLSKGDEKKEAAMVQDKLYMVTGTDGDERLPRILPKRFTHLLPKLQSSDYDYIIFDMPPMGQTSVTPRLAALMDVVLLVVESGKTNRDILQQANSILAETKTNVGVVFNRQRNYVPRALHQEL